MKYTDKEKILRDFIFGVKMVQNGAGEIKANINSTTFHQNYSFSDGLRNFKQLDHFSTTRQSLQHQKNEKKDC